MPQDASTQSSHSHVVIVGAGFAGIGAAVALGRSGIDYTIFERSDAVGGTWRDNNYPGCRCDVPSHLYSFSFEPNPDWPETYSSQSELFSYLRNTADRYGVTRRVRFNHEVLHVSWDLDARRWQIETNKGLFSADVMILGNGPLAEPAIPDIPGLDTFEGTTFHSARWRNDHDLRDERVGVIGTGASAIQFIPEIQPLAAKLTVFQRTPPWVLPHPNRRITDFERRLYRRVPLVQRMIRAGVYWSREIFATFLVFNPPFLRLLERIVASYIRARISDPQLRAKLIPNYRPGCKRLLLSNNYYSAIQRENVEVTSESIVEVRSNGIITADGVEHQLDTIIFGTGFHVTDNPIAEKVQGVDGRTLAEHWLKSGAQAYMGTAIPGFPNFFLLAGPNTGIGHTSLIYMIEAQIRYIIDGLSQMQERSISTVEVRQSAWQRWSDDVQRRAARTVWNSGGCASWYLDSEGRNTTLWPGWTFSFGERARHFDMVNYEVTKKIGAGAPSRGGRI